MCLLARLVELGDCKVSKRLASPYFIRMVLLPLALSLASQSVADQVTRYEYDALGRLVKVERERPGSTVEEAEYDYDPAGNRTNVTTNGANNNGNNNGNGGAQQGFVVTPLGGYSLIFYEN